MVCWLLIIFIDIVEGCDWGRPAGQDFIHSFVIVGLVLVSVFVVVIPIAAGGALWRRKK